MKTHDEISSENIKKKKKIKKKRKTLRKRQEEENDKVDGAENCFLSSTDGVGDGQPIIADDKEVCQSPNDDCTKDRQQNGGTNNVTATDASQNGSSNEKPKKRKKRLGALVCLRFFV